MNLGFSVELAPNYLHFQHPVRHSHKNQSSAVTESSQGRQIPWYHQSPLERPRSIAWAYPDPRVRASFVQGFAAPDVDCDDVRAPVALSIGRPARSKLTAGAAGKGVGSRSLCSQRKKTRTGACRGPWSGSSVKLWTNVGVIKCLNGSDVSLGTVVISVGFDTKISQLNDAFDDESPVENRQGRGIHHCPSHARWVWRWQAYR